MNIIIVNIYILYNNIKSFGIIVVRINTTQYILLLLLLLVVPSPEPQNNIGPSPVVGVEKNNEKAVLDSRCWLACKILVIVPRCLSSTPASPLRLAIASRPPLIGYKFAHRPSPLLSPFANTKPKRPSRQLQTVVCHSALRPTILVTVLRPAADHLTLLLSVLLLYRLYSLVVSAFSVNLCCVLFVCLFCFHCVPAPCVVRQSRLSLFTRSRLLLSIFINIQFSYHTFVPQVGTRSFCYSLFTAIYEKLFTKYIVVVYYLHCFMVILENESFLFLNLNFLFFLNYKQHT